MIEVVSCGRVLNIKIDAAVPRRCVDAGISVLGQDLAGRTQVPSWEFCTQYFKDFTIACTVWRDHGVE